MTREVNGIVPDGMKIERIIGMVMANLAGGYSSAPIQRLLDVIVYYILCIIYYYEASRSVIDCLTCVKVIYLY